MSKAVLVIDMPNCCEKCVLNSNNHSRPDYCKILIKPVNYIERRKDCPLKPIPEKKLPYTTSSDYLNGFDAGYNAYIDDAIGK